MKHRDSILHVRGQSQYIDDVPAPEGMVHMAVFGSPVAHGKILSLNTEEALNLEGVVAIITAGNIPGENQIGALIPDEGLLAEGEVHFMGHPVALVVAKTPEIARQALSKIKIQIEELPIITDPREAYEKGHIIGATRTFTLGDIDKTWEKCYHIFEGRCDQGGQEHLYLETQRARALPTEDGGVQIFSSTQSPTSVQKAAARVLGLPSHKVEVDVRRLGGGFGGKEDQATAWGCMAALGAWLLKKPVELVLHRLDDMRMTGKRHPYSSDFKIGLTKEGKILAYEVKHYQNAGASADLSPAILERTLFHSTNSYAIPNTRLFACSCRTNLPSNTAYRGFGGPQGMFVIESALAKAAREMGIPREELQRKNLLQEGDMFPYGQVTDRCRASQCWDTALQSYDFEKMKKEVEEHNQSHSSTKRGIALMPICFGISFTATFLNQGRSLVHVYTDGSVSITTGGIEMGQGITSNMIAIAAKTFGISEERIRIESTNTTRIANMSPTAASATTDLNGNATIIAAQQILKGMKKKIAQDLNVRDWKEIAIQDEKIYYHGSDTGITWQELVMRTYMARISLSAHGHYATPKISYDKTREKGRPFAYHVYGAAITAVTLDCLRGTCEIDSVKIIHDLGRSINPVIDLGQVEGGLAQGLGWMTLEELAFGEDGRLLSHALATYKAPDVYFMPDDLEVKFIEEDNPPGPYGAKAVGEPPLMYGIGVFFALQEAMKAFREAEYPFDSPLTPEKALLQIYKKSSDHKESAPGAVLEESVQRDKEPER